MVLGIRSKSRKTVSIQVHYIIHVQEIRPWPPSKSLRSAQSVVLQWENGDKNSGSFACSSKDGKIEINESFRLPLLLLRESSKRGKHHDVFQKNCLDFYLYERQNDKTAKSQLLGSATINIADFGVIKEITTIQTQVNCKKSFRSLAQPFLYINIQPVDVEGSDSSPKSSVSKEVSLDKEENESATQSVNDEDFEIASFTDDEIDDISSNTSQTVKSASETTGDKVEISKVGTTGSTQESVEPMETSSAGSHIEVETGTSLHSSSLVLSSDNSNTSCDGTSSPKFPEDHAKVAHASSRILESANSNIQAEAGASKRFNRIKLPLPSEALSSDTSNATYNRPSPKFSEDHVKVGDVSSKIPDFSSSYVKEEAGASKQLNRIKLHSPSMVLSSNTSNATYDRYSSPKFPEECVEVADASSKIPESTQQSNRQNISKGAMVKSLSSASYIMQSNIQSYSRSQDKELLQNPSEDDYARNGKIAGPTRPLSRKAREQPRKVLINDKPEDLTSLKLPLDTSQNYGLLGKNRAPEKAEENNTLNDDHVDAACHEGSNTNDSLNDNETKLKSEVQMLREELREAAALEISLYSVVADHGSSANKVHAPARRISRFYLHAFRVGSPASRANAAQSAVSGFVLVSKACGNDVPRLTFWLSNLILLRAIVSKGVEKIQLDDSLCINSDRNGSVNGSWLKRSPSCDGEKENAIKYFHSWEDPQTFLFALEKIEAWIFSRIVESVWWQTLTPHMQSAAAKSSSSRKVYGRRHSLGDQEQGSFSIDLWKRSFKDACERLCPLRAGGHGCGCLPVIARLVMEQLVNRLDVAMFNAILRESAEEMPTDPISDPISDSRVLPIPAGKSGFGAGAQLKNAIGNWSRWLSDLFDIDDSDSPENRNEDVGNGSPECETSFKAFYLLNSLSDLMMLPFEMLADVSQRKEVCPTFGVPLIKRVLNNFVPDEFCPGPIPDAVLESLNTEDIEDDEGSITSIPHIAAPTSYAPPPATSVSGITQEMGTQSLRRSGSSVVKKSYTSDDELDDLDSPLSAIGIDEHSFVSNKFPVVNEGCNFVRYELLREVWRDSE
ncbi:uncharacterized protein LOC114727059 [Neltuma alba]|uniref:uncharacterized protein LOC114727059 n=1 Tax=Neltuma alba TaxID=207710 RepID=UPI0010A2AFCF|nr:uncharacterized protein LOC114727059 [Prosopis alba]XP_028769620.1 uncharacterized protein LOC114727059 [Prosopis alba]